MERIPPAGPTAAGPPAEPVDDVMTPDVDAVEQQPAPELATVPVRVEGPVQAQTLPALHGRHGSVRTSATDAELLSGADARRGRLVLLLIGDPAVDSFFVGNSAQAAERGVGEATQWPAREPMVIRHREAVYVRSSTDGLVLSYWTELWAD